MNGFGGPVFMGFIFLAVIVTAAWLIAGKRKENNKNSSAIMHPPIKFVPRYLSILVILASHQSKLK